MRDEIANILSDWTNVEVRETTRGVAISGRYRGTLYVKHTGIAPDGPDTPDDPIAAAYWLDAFAKSRIAQSFEPALGAVEPPARYSPAAQDKSAGGSIPADAAPLAEPPPESEPDIAEPPPEIEAASGAQYPGVTILPDEISALRSRVIDLISSQEEILTDALVDPSRREQLAQAFAAYQNSGALGIPIAADLDRDYRAYLDWQRRETSLRAYAQNLRRSARDADASLLRAMASQIATGWPK